jgi:hypothetical protein
VMWKLSRQEKAEYQRAAAGRRAQQQELAQRDHGWWERQLDAEEALEAAEDEAARQEALRYGSLSAAEKVRYQARAVDPAKVPRIPARQLIGGTPCDAGR